MGCLYPDGYIWFFPCTSWLHLKMRSGLRYDRICATVTMLIEGSIDFAKLLGTSSIEASSLNEERSSCLPLECPRTQGLCGFPEEPNWHSGRLWICKLDTQEAALTKVHLDAGWRTLWWKTQFKGRGADGRIQHQNCSSPWKREELVGVIWTWVWEMN